MNKFMPYFMVDSADMSAIKQIRTGLWSPIEVVIGA